MLTKTYMSHTFLNNRFFSALIMLALVSSSALTQQKPPAKQGEAGQQSGGNSTGEARAYSSRQTVGITDPKAPVVFEDLTARTALINFKHKAGSPQKDYIVDSPPGGVAIFDYDGDGKPDIFLLNGSTFEAMRGKE